MFDTNSPKMRKQILGLLTNKWALGCFTILTFQQAIESSATLWLVNLVSNIGQGKNFYPYLLLYLASVALPYIPLCFASILKITWKQEAQRSFINAFVSSNKNNIGEWSNKKIKEEKLSLLTAEGPMAINTLIDYVWDLFTYVLSVFFNILALSIVVEPLFAIAYGLSVTCVVLVMKWKRRTQRYLTRKALAARVSLSQSLLAAWDNVLLGNNYNFNIWQDKTTQRIERCRKHNVDLERFDQLLVIFVSLVTYLPSLLVVFYYAYNHRNDPISLTSFVVILPLLFMILTYTFQTLSLAFRWSMHRSKLTAIYKAIQPVKDGHRPLEKKVSWSKIAVSPAVSSGAKPLDTEFKPIQSCSDLLTQASQFGRMTMRGENGSGKSTALMLLKNALSHKAFILPTHSQLSFISEKNNHSTGECLKERLQEILEKVDADVLLLDEWDANLDKENQEKLSGLIDDLSSKKCVIEVRHR